MAGCSNYNQFHMSNSKLFSQKFLLPATEHILYTCTHFVYISVISLALFIIVSHGNGSVIWIFEYRITTKFSWNVVYVVSSPASPVFLQLFWDIYFTKFHVITQLQLKKLLKCQFSILNSTSVFDPKWHSDNEFNWNRILIITLYLINDRKIVK